MTRFVVVSATLVLTRWYIARSRRVFDVKGAESERRDEVAVNSAFFSGYPINADLLRTSAEIGCPTVLRIGGRPV